jgi:hypothetical protein
VAILSDGEKCVLWQDSCMTTFQTLLATSFLFALPITSIAQEPADSDYIKPFPIVSYSQLSEEPELKILAKNLSKAYGLTEPVASKSNPVCCVWLEITNWNPNPGRPGYVILHQAGGTLISASNAEQLKIAVEQFIASARKMDGAKAAPRGLMTNHKVVAKQ